MSVPLGCAVSFDSGGNPFFQGWGITARILPYMEDQNKFNACNFSLANETPQTTCHDNRDVPYVRRMDRTKQFSSMMDNRVITPTTASTAWYVSGRLIDRANRSIPRFRAICT